MIEYKILRTIEIMQERGMSLTVLHLYKYLCKNPINTVEIDRKDLLRSSATYGAYLAALMRLWHDNKIDIAEGYVVLYKDKDNFSYQKMLSLFGNIDLFWIFKTVPFLRHVAIVRWVSEVNSLHLVVYLEKNFFWLSLSLARLAAKAFNRLNKKYKVSISNAMSYGEGMEPGLEYLDVFSIMSSVPVLGIDARLKVFTIFVNNLTTWFNNISIFFASKKFETTYSSNLSIAQKLLEKLIHNPFGVYLENILGKRALTSTIPCKVKNAHTYIA